MDTVAKETGLDNPLPSLPFSGVFIPKGLNGSQASCFNISLPGGMCGWKNCPGLRSQNKPTRLPANPPWKHEVWTSFSDGSQKIPQNQGTRSGPHVVS